MRCLSRDRLGISVLIAGVAITCGLVLMVAAGAARTLSAPDRYQAWSGSSINALVEQGHGAPRTAEIEALPSVDSVASATFVFGGLAGAEGEEPLDTLVFAGSQEAFGTRMVEGRPPRASAAGEFSASSSFVDETGARIGDRFELMTLTQATADEFGFDTEVPDGPRLTATLVGTFTGPTELRDDFAITAFPAVLLDVGDIGISGTQHAVALTPGAGLEDLRGQLDRLQDSAAFGVQPAELVPTPVRDAVDARGQGVAILALVLALAVLVVVGQLLGRQVALGDDERLAMSAMGMTRRDLLIDSLSRAALVVVAGVAIGAAVAVAVSGWFPLGFVADVEPSPGTRLEPAAHLLGAAGMAAALLAWVAASLRTHRTRQRVSSRSSAVDGLATRIRPIHASLALRFAFSDTDRVRGSAPAQFAGLAVVLGGVVAAVTFGASLNRVLEEPTRYGGTDLALRAGGSEIPGGVLDTLAADPDVESLVLATSVLASVGSDALDVTALDPVKANVSPIVLSGRLPASGGEIALGRITARQLDVVVGDSIRVDGPNGQTALRITGEVVIPEVEGGDGVGLGSVVTPAGLTRIDDGATYGAALIALRPDAPADTAERLSGDAGIPVGPADRPATILNLERVRSIPLAVATTLGGLTLLSLAHQLIVSGRHRRRDVAVLRAVGADRRWVTEVVHWQATLLAFGALVLALPLGSGVGRLVFRAFIDRTGAVDDPVNPWWGMAVTIVALVLLANLFATIPARRARRQRPALDLAGG